MDNGLLIAATDIPGGCYSAAIVTCPEALQEVATYRTSWVGTYKTVRAIDNDITCLDRPPRKQWSTWEDNARILHCHTYFVFGRLSQVTRIWLFLNHVGCTSLLKR